MTAAASCPFQCPLIDRRHPRPQHRVLLDQAQHHRRPRLPPTPKVQSASAQPITHNFTLASKAARLNAYLNTVKMPEPRNCRRTESCYALAPCLIAERDHLSK